MRANASMYPYHANGRLAYRTNAAGMWTSCAYDHVGNLLSANYQHSHAMTFYCDRLSCPTDVLDAAGLTSCASPRHCQYDCQ
jgi:hypothetical protein